MRLPANRTAQTAASNPPLRIPASEFACVYNRTRQTIHKWAKSGWFKEGGFKVERDTTHHLFILVPSASPNGQLNEDYQKFLCRKALALYPKIEARVKKLERKRPFPSSPERRAFLFVTALLGMIIWQVTGNSVLNGPPFEPTANQWEEIERRMRRIAELIENKNLKFSRKRKPTL